MNHYHHHPNIKKITVHGFRHTHASLLFEADADMKQAQDRLRHSNIKTPMNTYIHVTQEGKDETASLFDDFMANGKHVGQSLGQKKNPTQ
ncbi:tyrosine-type recombinase/integrase [Enterococcus hirae]|uniref:tyrosine-type recombinase/integrase n=1 Tax=Enterococcus hirae TaxID=1354 RepID=UPI0035237AB3